MKKCLICKKKFKPKTNDKYCSTKCSYEAMGIKKYSKHYEANPNEWIPHKAKMEWQCCDCGLVHNVWFRIGKLGFLEIKMTRNQKETLLVRKNKSSKRQ